MRITWLPVLLLILVAPVIATDEPYFNASNAYGWVTLDVFTVHPNDGTIDTGHIHTITGRPLNNSYTLHDNATPTLYATFKGGSCTSSTRIRFVKAACGATDIEDWYPCAGSIGDTYVRLLNCSSLGGDDSVSVTINSLGADVARVNLTDIQYSLIPSWTVSPLSGSGYPPLNVKFTDTTGSGTAWLWDFGDGNTTGNTLQNPDHYYVNSGTYTVKLNVTSGAMENQTVGSYTVNPYTLPNCSYTASALSGNSPLTISYNDTSTGDPTTSFWNFNPDALGWITVTPHETNTSFDVTVTYEGSGEVNILHYVTNPAGTSNCPNQFINLSGMAPNPTPTPSIPFPNQTGICLGSRISLGSQWTSDYNTYYTTDYPNGNGIDGYYPNGTIRITDGDTSQLGQYFYNEYNLSNQLEYRSSYVVVDCFQPTQQITNIPTVVPTISYNPIPIQYPTVIPTFNYTSDMSTVVNYNVSPFQTLEPQFNTTNFVNLTDTRERILAGSPMFEIYLNMVDGILGPLVTQTLAFIAIAFVFITGITAPLIFVLGLFNNMLTGFNDIFYIFVQILHRVLDAIPIKLQNAITFCLILDILDQVWNLKRGDKI